MKKEIDVQISAKVLYDYMLYHTYTSFAGIIGVIIGILFIVAFICKLGLIYLVAGIVILGYLPWTLLLRANTQMTTNPAFKEPLHYTFSEEGMSVSQNGVTEQLEWEFIVKATSTSRSIIIYTSKVNASILPKKQLGEDLPDVVKIISTHMPPSKVNIR